MDNTALLSLFVLTQMIVTALIVAEHYVGVVYVLKQPEPAEGRRKYIGVLVAGVIATLVPASIWIVLAFPGALLPVVGLWSYFVNAGITTILCHLIDHFKTHDGLRKGTVTAET